MPETRERPSDFRMDGRLIKFVGLFFLQSLADQFRYAVQATSVTEHAEVFDKSLVALGSAGLHIVR